jgi:hypothetical protein
MTPTPETPTPDDKPTLPQGPGFAFTFLYYFVGTALVTALLATQTLGVGLETGIPNRFGLLFGVVGGGIGALTNRSRSLTLPCPSQKNFQQQLNTILTDMGYAAVPDARTDGVMVYRRNALRQLFSGPVYVLLEGKQAHISSRTVQLGRIQRQLEAAGIR